MTANQIARVAMLRILRRLAPPSVAAREAIAFLEARCDVGAVLGEIRPKVRGRVEYGIELCLTGMATRSDVEGMADTLALIGYDIASTQIGVEARGIDWASSTRVGEIFEGWLLGDPDVCDPLYREDT